MRESRRYNRYPTPRVVDPLILSNREFDVMNMDAPKNVRLTVVMPVHNDMPYLPQAIQSILDQSYREFVFLIGDDESTDGSSECIRGFAARDSRIQLLQKNAKRLGPVGSSNWVAQHAQTPLVARMDADDVCGRERLAAQISVMDHNADAVLVGTLYSTIDSRGSVVLKPDLSILTNGFRYPVAHGSIMYRKAVFDEVGGYRNGTDYYEDTDLYLRMARQGSLLVVTDSLFSYRHGLTSARLNDDPQIVENALERNFCGQTAASGTGTGANGRVTPRVMISMGLLRLWSGQNPGILLRMVKRMRITPIHLSMLALLWAVTSTLCPWGMRRFLILRRDVRNWLLAGRIRPGHVYRWYIGRPAMDLGPLRPADTV